MAHTYTPSGTARQEFASARSAAAPGPMPGATWATPAPRRPVAKPQGMLARVARRILGN